MKATSIKRATFRLCFKALKGNNGNMLKNQMLPLKPLGPNGCNIGNKSNIYI